MAGSRRKHSAEFKREAVRLTYEPGRTVAEVAADEDLLARVARLESVEAEVANLKVALQTLLEDR